jgi:hypothetical protein
VSAPDAADALVAGSADRIALIVMREDAAGALELCRALHEHRADVHVALRGGGTGNGATPAPRGRPMPAKFPGRCAACNGPINIGTPITYDAESRKATHMRCT